METTANQILATIMQMLTPQAHTLASASVLRQKASVRTERLADHFSNFRTHGDATLSEMLREACQFAAAMCSSEIPAYWLSLVGSSGTGKTMLAQAINAVFQRHIEGFLVDETRGRSGIDRFRRTGGFLSWPKCIDRMLEGDYGFMRQAGEDWFLVIDDVGAQYDRHRELSATKLFSILNERQGKFTVLTANLSAQQIAEKLDVRIASRLLRHGGVVIDSTGVLDYGLRKLKGAA